MKYNSVTMTKKVSSIRLTEAQLDQIMYLEERGYGNRSTVITTAIDRMYQDERRRDIRDIERRTYLIQSLAEEGVTYNPDWNMTTNKLDLFTGFVRLAKANGDLTPDKLHMYINYCTE